MIEIAAAQDRTKYRDIGEFSSVYAALFTADCLTWFAYVYRWADEVKKFSRQKISIKLIYYLNI